MSETFTSVSQGEAGLRDRTRLTFDLDADICVIGAGLAGLTIALEAARLGASVAVLEGATSAGTRPATSSAPSCRALLCRSPT